MPLDQWVHIAWRFDPPVSGGSLRALAAAIRAGCQSRRYWLRAYAALPDRVALLIYPLEETVNVLEDLKALMGGAPVKFRAIRDDADLERSARFIEGLPVRSHLAERPDEYPLSSVGWLRNHCPPASLPSK